MRWCRRERVRPVSKSVRRERGMPQHSRLLSVSLFPRLHWRRTLLPKYVDGCSDIEAINVSRTLLCVFCVKQCVSCRKGARAVEGVCRLTGVGFLERGIYPLPTSRGIWGSDCQKSRYTRRHDIHGDSDSVMFLQPMTLENSRL